MKKTNKIFITGRLASVHGQKPVRIVEGPRGRVRRSSLDHNIMYVNRLQHVVIGRTRLSREEAQISGVQRLDKFPYKSCHIIMYRYRYDSFEHWMWPNINGFGFVMMKSSPYFSSRIFYDAINRFNE